MDVNKKRVIFILLLPLLSLFTFSACSNEKDNGADKGTIHLDFYDDRESNNVEHGDNGDNTDNTDATVINDKGSITYTTVYTEDFEGTMTKFAPRGNILAEVIKGGYESEYAFYTSNRTETWQGPLLDITDIVIPGGHYSFLAMIKYDGIPDKKRINLMLDHNNGASYISCGMATAVNSEWVSLSGNIVIPEDSDSIYLYFETDYKATAEPEDLINIYIDDLVIQRVDIVNADTGSIPLYQVHEEYFKIGIGILTYEINSPDHNSIVLKHFNSITMGNEMKPDYILDYTACSTDPYKYNLEPAIHFKNLDTGLRFAYDNNIALRGHTLVWHSQTPDWFFKENYSKEEDALFVSKEVMTARLESYIKQVLTYCQENYPGVIYAWDVVNEAIETGHGEEGGYRSKDSLWYQVIGPDFVELAFTYAKKYADDDVKLFYNDYNCHLSDRRAAIYNLAMMLKEKGVIDGIGMQSHYGLGDPSIMTIQETLTMFGGLGLEIQITELDINTEDGSEEGLKKLGIRYKRLMNMYRYVDDNKLADITSITIWGLSDKDSWLHDTKQKYPLLFDEYLQPKDAFWGFYLHEDIPLY